MDALLSAGGVLNDLVTYMFDNNGNVTKEFSDAISLRMMPLGSMQFWLGSSVPSGFLIANGQAVSRTEYASLYALFGTQHGAGNGTTTFNLPNMSDRVAMGASAAKAVGSSAGSNSVTLTVPNLPKHKPVILAAIEKFLVLATGPGTNGEVPDGAVIRKTPDEVFDFIGGDVPVDTTPAHIAGFWIIRF